MYLIGYDIQDNQLRKKISDKIIEFGLDRIQYSVYLGVLSTDDLNTLENWLQQLLPKPTTPNSILIFNLTPLQVKTVKIIGASKFDISEIVREKITLIF